MTSDFLPKNKQLWESRGNIRLGNFLKGAERLGLRITQPNKGTSHFAVRKPDIVTNGLESLITNVYEGMSKQAKGDVIKSLLKYGIKEDNLWKALDK